MAPPAEAQFGARMRHALLVHPRADAGLAQRLRGAVFQDAGAHPMLDVVTVAAFQDRRLDALQMKQLREEQPGRPRADDHHLSAHGMLTQGAAGSSSRKSRLGTKNSEPVTAVEKSRMRSVRPGGLPMNMCCSICSVIAGSAL